MKNKGRKKKASTKEKMLPGRRRVRGDAGEKEDSAGRRREEACGEDKSY